MTLVPLITLAGLKAENHGAVLYNIPEQMEDLERESYDLDLPLAYKLDAPMLSVHIEIFAVSFIAALLVYLWFKHRMPRHDYGQVRLPPQ